MLAYGLRHNRSLAVAALHSRTHRAPLEHCLWMSWGVHRYDGWRTVRLDVRWVGGWGGYLVDRSQPMYLTARPVLLLVCLSAPHLSGNLLSHPVSAITSESELQSASDGVCRTTLA